MAMYSVILWLGLIRRDKLTVIEGLIGGLIGGAVVGVVDAILLSHQLNTYNH